jgi:uncharacterized protein (TIGR00369 family)
VTEHESKPEGEPADQPAGAVDGLTRWLGLRWESHDRVRLSIRPDLINPAGLLGGPVAYAMIDYCMGSTLWEELEPGERIATIGISINYVRTAREGELICEAALDRRNDRVAVLSAKVVTEEGLLAATAVGSFSIFPARRLGEHGESLPAHRPTAR